MADDTYTVVRTTTIDAPPERVYEHVVDLHRWTSWSPWEDLDPAVSRTYTGPESGPGSAYSWSGNRKAGQGTMRITDAQAPSEVHIDLAFLKPFKSRSKVVFSIEPAGAGSRVTWMLSGRKTTATKVMGIFKSMDSLIGPDFEKGLARLKATAEA
jgi:uncharacterized protein YndB with AHSA1/START domain